MLMTHRFVLSSAVLLAVLGAGLAAETRTAVPAPQKPVAPAARPATPGPPGATVIVFDTVNGTVEISLLTAVAPRSTAHIIDLVRKHFYRGQRVHRVIGSLAQFGDPQTKNVTLKDSWGTQGSGSPIGVAEISKTEKHVRGAVGLGYAEDARQADSQIYIMKTESPSLNGRYAIIGHVIAGMPAVDKWDVGEVIRDCYVKGEKK
jgi:peptidylprolyl isomerase